MAWTQADIDAIDVALKSNVTKVRFADREVTYRSIKELMEVRNLASSIVGESSDGNTVRRHIRVYTSKGNG